jgi:hypothetical protein
MSLMLARGGAESRGTEASTRGISLFADQIADRYQAVRSIWVIGARAGGDMPDAQSAFDWELVAFAEAATLRALRRATDLHRPDVLLRVVTDGDRFHVAWGPLHMSGSLFQWDWREASERHAYYSEARWTLPAGTGNVERVRRRAACVWRSKSGTSGDTSARGACS